MRIRLYLVHGSHPCATVQKALAIKGLSYSVIEWPPPLHALMQRLIFGVRTVPGIQIDGERIVGSRAIVQRLEELVPQPALFPGDQQQRAAVLEAERWGDDVFQPVARQLLWVGFQRRPEAMVSYSAHSRLPMPAAAIRLSAPLIVRAEARLNRTDAKVARNAMLALPAQLDRIDAWIADGTMGIPGHPNAADLQIGATLRLLMTIADALVLIEGRPCAQLALRLFPESDGELPPGALPAV